MAQRLQASAGNRAVSALVAQRRKAARPAKPVAQRSPSPRSGPGVPAQRATTATAPSTTTASGTIAPDTSAAIVSASPAAPTLEPTAPQSSTAADLAVQRAPVETATPVRRPPASASSKFAAVRADVGRKQKTVAAHPPARSEAARAQGAAKPPPDDKEAQGKTRNAEKMNAAKPGSFDKAAFITAVNEAIAAQAPKNLDEAEKFGDSGRADAVKGQVQGQVAAGTDASAKAIATTTKAAPDTSAAKEKPVTPLVADKPPATPARPDPGNAVPDKAPPAATDFSAGPAQVDRQMADAKVTDDQLAKSNEPEFTGALKQKKAAEKHAATAPAQVRAEEKETLAGAKAQAATAGATAMTALAGDRKQAGSQVDSGKEKAKSADETKRAKVTAVLQKVFDTTKKDVEGILSGLDKKVDAAFTKGEKAARDAFTADHKRRMKTYKDKRYSGPLGGARWLKDKFAGLPAEANQIFTAARQGYVTRMQQVISGVADIISTELDRAKKRIAAGRNQLQAAVRKLPADLQAIGRQAAGQFTAKFDQLVDSVDAKGKQLVQTLASKYNEALKAVDAEINAEKEKNRGLVAKAVDAVKGAIDTILQLKEMLMGVLAKAAQAVMAILKDPIGFLRNLASAVGSGLKLFIGNIGTHLKKGLIGWLLGAMAGAGLQMPAKFDLRGIITMIASMLGLTWASIRARVVQRGVPERAMTTVEQTVPVAQKLQSQGVAGVTDEIAGQVGDLKGNLLSKISEYLIPTVLIAGITWIISLLNPASAFIRACKMIIDFMTFVVTQGAQIIQFVHAILDAVIAIAGGGAGGVPGLIENALSRSIPVLIGALAALLGIGGIAGRIQSFFRTLTRPVNRVVNWITDKIVSLGRKIWARARNTISNRRKENPDGSRKSKEQVADAAAHDAYQAISRRARLGDIPGILNTTLNKWRAKGVKSLSLKFLGGARFTVIAKVNPTKPSPAAAWLPPPASNVQHLLSYEQAREGNSATWATGAFAANSMTGVLFGPSKSQPYAAARKEATVAQKSHAEETVTARFREYFKEFVKEGGAGPHQINIEMHVGCSCCVNCASYIAGFVRSLRAAGHEVNARIKFASLYMGGQMSGPRANPTTVPQSTVDNHRKLFEAFIGSGFMEPGTGALQPTTPGRYWGTAEELDGGNPANEHWYTIQRSKNQGKLALAILAESGVSVEVLEEQDLSGQLTQPQQLNLQSAGAALQKAIAAVNAELQKMKAEA
ncbi:hypothetical protein ACK8GG_14650 [Micromonosporaceae bacterium DT55]|uniref:phage tail protein n=1 Tax=Melissospora conviva TaxID=3388432 RepID=UPI003C282FC9